LTDQDWIGLMIFTNSADRTGLDSILSDQDWIRTEKFHGLLISGCQVHDQNFHFLQTFAGNNCTQRQIEKSQQELKRTHLENRRYKNLAELAAVYHKMCKSQVTEYEDGKRKKIKKKEMVGFISLQ